MMSTARLPLILVSLLALASGAQESLLRSPQLGAVRQVLMGSTPGTESAHFRLDYLDASGAPDGAPFGTVRWLTGPVMGEESSWRAEREVNFLELGKRVSHLEQLMPGERSLSYRELNGAYGRRLQLSWLPDGQGTSVDKAGRQRRRREFELKPGAALPLALIELARRGQALPEKMVVYQPLAGEFEELSIQVIRDVESRTLRLQRKDGSSAGSYRFEGNQLISFRWQAGSVIATRIGREEFLAWTQPPALAEDPGQRSQLARSE